MSNIFEKIIQWKDINTPGGYMWGTIVRVYHRKRNGTGDDSWVVKS